jgi:hypothetical protein
MNESIACFLGGRGFALIVANFRTHCTKSREQKKKVYEIEENGRRKKASPAI